MLSIPLQKKCQLKKDAWLFRGQLFGASQSHVYLSTEKWGAVDRTHKGTAIPLATSFPAPTPSEKDPSHALMPHSLWARFACL